MITYITLILSSVVTVVFIMLLLKGKSYDYLTEALDSKQFQLKEFYSVGFVWIDILSKSAFYEKQSQAIKPNCAILYEDKFAEYYTRVYIAQGFTFAHLSIVAIGLLAGLTSGATSLLLFIVGIVVGVVLLMNSLKTPKELVEKRAEDCVIEFPNMVTKLALLINSGMILREAWFLVAESTTGELNSLMRASCETMKNGKSDIDAIYEFGVKSGSKELKKFSSILVQGLEKGNSELADLLTQQSSELWEIKRQKMLQKGDVAATKLVIPTTLMFAGIILVIVSSALSGMSL